MNSGRHITIYTILGSLPFISKLHLKSIKEAADTNISIVAFGGRSKDVDIEYELLFRELGIEYTFLKRDQYKFNTSCVDGNYDFLMSKVNPKDIFIVMHDDCIIGKNSNIFSIVRNKLAKYEFCGKLENNFDMQEICRKLDIKNISKYENLLINNESMHDKRIGTWFLSGNYRSYKSNKLSFGDGIRIFNYLSNILLNNYKFKLKVPMLKLDGGFNFNLKIHKNNIPYYILEDDIDITHLVHATNFFVKKGFNNGLGSFKEWEERWNKMKSIKKLNEIKKEKNFLRYLNDKLISINQPYKELVELVDKFSMT